ncbi:MULTISPECIES: LacI family DNA-binding transcriptional regulator [unclassified Paenibacillus]|uniref:LacI family DNA-binding transcriptional regulator n=1 Tax=unclassified Paenibacillus TaxID=185978 RepID=UPI000956F135|nr:MULTISPECIES: LacI family DNA-binding transcriptional regulator [unclassified Paenibacillus]ASS68441.1 LacI family transcriptional regulator [Paenibacillus sp. RUD330]SIR33652.1 LacI family transcriptional regulator/LacI family transcriptional regulator, repressor for deo operon, udp, cdd, tsx, nupC, and nupG [Paenibacillus sp. RU4X]SIR44510.1 LacI family transcriptional regulator/LacI family transcriptional regulator, repressor for deo operon, udp, cdd, tsx, nupC, and nupG [Paenibacillus sp.
MAKLKDIADLLGVSISTVSRAISGDTSRPVSEETKRKIKAAAIQVGYPLQGMAPQAIGMPLQYVCILPGNLMGNHPYFAEVLEGFHGRLAEMGLPPAIMRSYEELREAGKLRSMLDETGAGAVLALGWYDRGMHRTLVDSGIPVAGVSLNDDSIRIPTVDCDRMSAARMAVRHLLDQGHRRIGYVGGPAFDKIMENDERYLGYKFAILQADLPFRPEWIVDADWSVEKSYADTAAMLSALAPEDRPTALFCASDTLAIPAMRAAMDLGCRIPEDIAFAGMDNIELAQYTSPPLTSVHVPRLEIGRTACKFLYDFARGEYRDVPKLLLPCSLVVRESSDRRLDSSRT